MESIDAEDYATAEGIQALYELLVKGFASDQPAALEVIFTMLQERVSDAAGRHYLVQAVAHALAAAGAPGIDLLAEIVRTNRFPTHRSISLKALWSVASGEAPAIDLRAMRPVLEIDEHLIAHARAVAADLMVEAASNRSVFDAVASSTLFQFEGVDTSGESLADFFIATLSESSIGLTTRLVDEFDSLLERELTENYYQAWLTDHPVFLDPLAADISPLAPLGLEFKTDFVMRLHDGRYTLVEIERPQDRLFTGQVDFTKRFTHATGQILDFQHWVAHNVAYAQQRFPGIRTPDGLLVMGMRRALDARRTEKLERWQFNSRSIQILTFDDLSMRARLLITSLRREPLKIHGRV